MALPLKDAASTSFNGEAGDLGPDEAGILFRFNGAMKALKPHLPEPVEGNPQTGIDGRKIFVIHERAVSYAMNENLIDSLVNRIASCVLLSALLVTVTLAFFFVIPTYVIEDGDVPCNLKGDMCTGLFYQLLFWTSGLSSVAFIIGLLCSIFEILCLSKPVHVLDSLIAWSVFGFKLDYLMWLTTFGGVGLMIFNLALVPIGYRPEIDSYIFSVILFFVLVLAGVVWMKTFKLTRRLQVNATADFVEKYCDPTTGQLWPEALALAADKKDD